MNFRFADPQLLHLFFLLPLLGVFLWAVKKRGGAVRNRSFHPKAWEWSTRSLSLSKRRWIRVFQFLGLALAVLAWARPQFGEGQQKVKSEGLEIVLAVDVSTSMLAEDAKPSRLELTKRELQRFLGLLGGDKVGIVAFAGSAVTLSPLTPDKNALLMYIDSLAPDAVSTQGTRFDKALLQAHDLLIRGGLENDEQSHVTKVVVLVSDGEDFSQEAEKAARDLKKDGIRVFSLVVGTEKGAPIPLRDRYGNLTGYKRDASNQVVLSQSKGQTLSKLAGVTGGTFNALVFGGSAIPRLVKDLNALQKSEFESMEMVQYNEGFQYFLFPAVLCFLLALSLSDRRRLKGGKT
jgi:Ca-activated chloride channel family protein